MAGLELWADPCGLALLSSYTFPLTMLSFPMHLPFNMQKPPHAPAASQYRGLTTFHTPASSNSVCPGVLCFPACCWADPVLGSPNSLSQGSCASSHELNCPFPTVPVPGLQCQAGAGQGADIPPTGLCLPLDMESSWEQCSCMGLLPCLSADACSSACF